jgi:hypothetical protein
MNTLNRVAGYVVIASVFAVSACVFSPDRGHGRDDTSGNRHYEGDRHCDQRDRDDHRGDCRDTEHHRE